LLCKEAVQVMQHKKKEIWQNVVFTLNGAIKGQRTRSQNPLFKISMNKLIDSVFEHGKKH
jgi:ABC-type uncharacterized transport system YnjBCD ATPase subunit